MTSRISEKKVEVGGEILSYCGKCKDDTTHIISVMENNNISKVMCRTCNSQHNYRKPNNAAADKPAAKPPKTAKPASPRKGQTSPSKKWADLLLNQDLNSARDYNMKQNYEQSAIIRHSSFGVGIVTKKVNQNTIEAIFETGAKILVINRK